MRASQWFQQNGATPHTANEKPLLGRGRGSKRDSLAEDAMWNGPHTHQILAPSDFYLWGFLRDNVYQGNPQTIEELKTAITEK